MIVIVAAHSTGSVIGCGGKLPWHLPADMARFRKLTLGNTIVMGRGTYESIGSKELPERQNVVVSSVLPSGLQSNGVYVVSSLDEAVAKFSGPLFVIGGALLYAAAIPKASVMYITHIHKVYDGDTFFPSPAWNNWALHSSEYRLADSKNEAPMTFEVWKRK